MKKYEKWFPVAKVIFATLGAGAVQLATIFLEQNDYILDDNTRLLLTVGVVFISGYLAPRAAPLPT